MECADAPMTAAILAEIHRAIQKLGGNSQPMSPADAARTVRELGADVDLRSIADSWAGATLDDDEILDMLRNWNAGIGVFAVKYAERDDGPPPELPVSWEGAHAPPGLRTSSARRR